MNRRCGICLPLSAIWSHRSSGCGEFLDLLPMLDWLKQSRMEVLQLLPLNDTGAENSPYSAISTCALNPLYLSLWALPGLSKTMAVPPAALSPPSATNHLDLQGVRDQKLRFLDQYLSKHQHQLLQDPSVVQFFEEHGDWLRPYAAFTWQKLRQQGHPFWDWGLHIADAIAATPESWFQREALIQYLCWNQLLEVRRRADQLGILLFGDLPILCNRDSVDVWANPELFDLSLEAGAPPDFYNPKGQAWGFPIFRWSGHVSSGFSWWRRRLQLAARAYHLLRIDHILGFFRIWAVPLGCSAEEGFYLPKDSEAWLPQGEAILRLLQQSAQLELVGEDLGVRLDGLHQVLQRLGIPGMSVLRWMREWESDLTFIPPEHYPRLSLACLSTHDSSMIGEWWREEPLDAEMLCVQYGKTYELPISSLHREWLLRLVHSARSSLIVNLLPEYMACFPDLIPTSQLDQRLNLPGTVSPLNWTLRLPASVEAIVSHRGLLALMRDCASISSATGF
jgi:4-alpha-glucanotransferase